MTTDTRTTILVLGGYGTFGGRLAQLLADEARLTLLIAGRSRTKAEAFCATLGGAAKAIPAAFDREREIEPQLSMIKPDIVVDASGPFQAYGENPYRVVEAAIALGIHYVDLSDGADFVRGIACFDAAARVRGVFVLSGVSSCPVLTAAVVRQLSAGMARVESIAGGIAPSPYADIGANVIRAIASYAGKPVALWRDGRRTSAPALIDSRLFTVAPPGRLPLHARRFSLVEVPDLELLPELWPSLRTVWMGVGTVPEIWLRGLNALAWLVWLRLLPSLLPIATLIHRARTRLSWGEHRGGMFVTVSGTLASGTLANGVPANGAPVERSIERSWHMIAEGDDGPFVPSMAAEAIIRHCLAGRMPKPGARVGVNDVELADYEATFARRRIVTGTRQTPEPNEPLYRRILGDAYAMLPQPLQVMHDLKSELTATGVGSVKRGKGLLARLAAAIVGFPPEGDGVLVEVAFRLKAGRELWQRNFAGRQFASTQEEGKGRNARLMCERFGVLSFAMALVVEEERMRLVMRRWSLFGLPLPLALAPRIDAFEHVEDDRFRFHVEISHPLTGLIVRYRGWLVPRA
jgi:Domain of unknown function (DUF4166)/Saccharopine dehydrogenase NADP binding domain